MISPISAYSGYNSMASIKPINYKVNNEAAYSSVYTKEATKTPRKVNASSPVRYPDAEIIGKKADTNANAIKANAAYNDAAAKFQGAFTYNNEGSGVNLKMIGKAFDAYA